jgi:hypothetical protein
MVYTVGTDVTVGLPVMAPVTVLKLRPVDKAGLIVKLLGLPVVVGIRAVIVAFVV